MDKHALVLNRKASIYVLPTPSLSVTLHFGGTFHTRGDAKYIGGRQLHLQNVQKDVLTLHLLGSVLSHQGVKKPFRLYNYVQDGFILILDDKGLNKLCDEKVKGDGSLANVDVDIPEFSGETDDLEFDIDDVEYDYELDDKWFADNVDLDVEWFPELSTECDNLEKSKVQEGLEIRDSCEEEDIVICHEDLDSGKDSNDDKREQKFPMFNSEDLYKPTFELGMNFDNKKLLRQAIHSHAVSTNRNINITKNDNDRVHAKCADNECGWMLHGLNVKGDSKFQIRKYNSKHTCAKSFHVKNMRADWISGKYLNKFKSDPKRSIKGFRDDAIQDTRCHISPYQAYRAKRKALDVIEGDSVDQYSFLWEFIEEVKRSNPESSVILSNDDGENGETRFGKLYMCLDALKKGFLSGCRPFLGLDGCHLTGPHEGVMLTAVGVDPNNNIFPLAMAVVCKEDRHTWEWFLTLLKVDLDISEDYGWTFMSDKQKGLIRAVHEVFPNATHRFCVRHLHENFKRAGYTGQNLKSALWKAARACTVNEFEKRMEELKDLNGDAHKWFENKPPEQWSKSYFNDIPKCDMLLNNGCESFNSCILEAREKPIVSMLEWILEYLMKRMQKNRDKCEEKWTGPYCPKIQKLIDDASDKVGDCIPVKADKLHYQITCFDGSKYAVDLEKGTCGCRRWDLSGIPCKHALSAIYFEKLGYNDFVNICYKVDTYKKVYGHVIMPINGRSEWRPTGYIPPQPPNVGRGVGRPERSRRRGIDEPSQKMKKRTRGKPQTLTRLKRQQETLKCGECGLEGHNRKSCGQHTNSTQGVQMRTENDQLDVQEEIVLSQYRATQNSQIGGSGNQLNNEGEESSRPSKLKVRRKGDDIACTNEPNIVGQHATTLRSGKCLKTAPTPFEQLQDCQVEKGPNQGGKKKYKSLSQI